VNDHTGPETVLTFSVRDWQSQAACRGRDPRWWFVAPGTDPIAAGVAARICAGCPVQSQCGAEAERLHRDGEPLYGTWAGVWFSQ
jgi:hypothetical protein